MDPNPVAHETALVPEVAAWCGHCGLASAEADHAACLKAFHLEPPRYCQMCRRRMVVQVLPVGWTALCSQHGVLASADPA